MKIICPGTRDAQTSSTVALNGGVVPKAESSVTDVVSVVVTVVNETLPNAGNTANAPLPVEHVNVGVEEAAMSPVTVNTMALTDVVTAVTDPTLLVHVGSLALTKMDISPVIVIVSDTSFVPETPVLSAFVGLKENVMVVGLTPTNTSLAAHTNIEVTALASRMV
jgi:hypothetical protein|tara:strand:+ start:8741 stop:9235 length:495 start_codon:yes stop_codon:yes gene_type:complete